MKHRPRRLILVLIALVAGALASAAPEGRVYELRTYTATAGNLDKLLALFREHTLKLFEKHGMTNVGYWSPMDEKDGAADKLVYLLSYPNRDAATASWKAFRADAHWQEVRKKTEAEAGGKILAKVDSVFLAPTDYAKAMDGGKAKGAQRVFELRMYTAMEGKLGALDARFRDHTVALFKKHGIMNLGYFHPTDADKGAANTLIYFLAHPSREAAAASFKAFREDAAWVKARTASEQDGKLVAKVESVFLNPVDFSPMK